MKKQTLRLTLNRETIRRLDEPTLRRIEGGVDTLLDCLRPSISECGLTLCSAVCQG
jgi:hypothetical protein